MDSVLIACPTHVSKEYAAQQWIDAVRALDYPADHLELLWIDNTRGNIAFAERWHRQVPIRHREFEENANRRIAYSMECIRQHFITSTHNWWLNIESDIIVPPETVDVLLNYAYGYEELGYFTESSFIYNPGAPADWLAAPYLCRSSPNWTYSCFGCTLFSRNLATVRFDQTPDGLAKAPDSTSTDGWYRNRCVNPLRKYNLVDLNFDVLSLQHLDDPEHKEWAYW